MVCWTCAQTVDEQDRFCRHCGIGQGANLPWYYEPFWIGFLALFAMGPFALSLVWKTPKLSTRGRWLFTAGLLFLTAYIIFSLKRSLDLVRSFL